MTWTVGFAIYMIGFCVAALMIVEYVSKRYKAQESAPPPFVAAVSTFILSAAWPVLVVVLLLQALIERGSKS